MDIWKNLSKSSIENPLELNLEKTYTLFSTIFPLLNCFFNWGGVGGVNGIFSSNIIII